MAQPSGVEHPWPAGRLRVEADRTAGGTCHGGDSLSRADRLTPPAADRARSETPPWTLRCGTPDMISPSCRVTVTLWNVCRCGELFGARLARGPVPSAAPPRRLCRFLSRLGERPRPEKLAPSRPARPPPLHGAPCLVRFYRAPPRRSSNANASEGAREGGIQVVHHWKERKFRPLF